MIAEANRIMYGVSIHAPTGGATCTTIVPFFFRRVSIHAPTGGATARARYR